MYFRLVSGPDPRGGAVAPLDVPGDAPRAAAADGSTVHLLGVVVGHRDATGRLVRGDEHESVGWLASAPDFVAAARRLEGRFVAIRTSADGSAQVVADRFGQVDVYHRAGDGWAVVGSDLDAVGVEPGEPHDQAALAHALSVYGYRPPKRHTPFTGIHRAGIGESLTLAEGSVQVAAAPFAATPAADYGRRELDEYADLLLDAVEARGSADGNVVYLSSGWDSTALLASLVHVFGARGVRAVIGRMQYSERSGVCNRFELERAAAVAAHYGVELDIAELDYVRPNDALLDEMLPLLSRHHLCSVTAFNHAILADHTARTQGGPVFCGEISDGAHNLGFSQFVTVFHPSYEFREYADKMASYLFGPAFVGSLLAGTADGDLVHDLFRSRAGDAVFDPVAADGPAIVEQVLSSLFLRNVRMPFWSLDNVAVLTPEGRRRYAEDIGGAYLRGPAAAASPSTLYSWYLHLYNSFHWQGSTVACFGLTAEARGLRPAIPFWDSRLQEFLATMPESWGRGLDLNPTKHPLKWMLANRVDYPFHLQTGPHSYTYDVDPTFNHHVELLWHSGLVPRFRAALEPRRYRDVLDDAVFEVAYLDGLVDQYLAGTELRGAALNDLIALLFLSLQDWSASNP